MSTRIHRALVLLLALAAPPAAAADLAAQLAKESRAAEDRARDAGRKPAEVVAFLGIGEGMTVVDLIAAGGYYTEVLSYAVGAGGKVYAQNTAFALQIRDGANDRAMAERLADGRLPNVERLDREISALELEPGSIDAAVTALNFHDVLNGGGKDAAAGFLATIHTFLRPGGVLGVIDHAGNAGTDLEALHRMQEKDARALAEAAGFEIESSELLRNPADDRTLYVFDPAIRGKTDRFLLKLRKPEAR